MKIGSLHLKAFGPFEDRVVDFGGPSKSLVLVYGPNEAGKSAMLRAIEALRFQIDPRSPDNFLHDYTSMCVGGTFLSADDTQVTVMRLKRLKDPLRMAKPLGHGKLEVTDMAAPSALQEQLTGHLSREEYARMFGLDHDSLRAGGQRLADGDVEVGASLFEASLGVRDIAAIAQELDTQARELFMPGARGTKGRINEALRRHKELQQEIKAASTRPREWQDRYTASERANDEVARLERQQMDLSGRQSLLATLRGAAPVIRDLDDALAVLTELDNVPDLPVDTGERRTAATAGIEAARNALESAAEAEELAHNRLAELQVDPAVLEQSAAIVRIVAKAEEVDALRSTIGDLKTQHERQLQGVRRMAAEIDRDGDAVGVLALVPSEARQVEFEERAHALITAQQALDNHSQAAPDQQVESEETDLEQSTAAAIGQFRGWLTELESERNALPRLQTLIGEIAGAQAKLHQLLSDLGLPDEAALESIRSILDAEIDEAARSMQETENRNEALTSRVGHIEPALHAAVSVRDRMRNDQAVVTVDEVHAAREQREQKWQCLRSTFIDASAKPPGAGVQTLPQEYESAVQEADERADGYARDTAAAAELKAKDAEIERYERDQKALSDALDGLELTSKALRDTWRAKLAAHGLQERAPLALREWQGLLKEVRAVRLSLAGLRNEQEQAKEVQAKLRYGLRTAIEAIEAGSTSTDDALPRLEITARRLEAKLQQRQQSIDAKKTRVALLATQAEKRAARQELLEGKLGAALARFAELGAELRLPPDSSHVAVRARVAELVHLRDADSDVLDTEESLAQANAGLAQIASDARCLSVALNIELVEGGENLRPFLDRLEERLDRAREAQTNHQAAQRDLANALETVRVQQGVLSRHEATMHALCELASVERAELLPDVESRAQRKRDAKGVRERCLNQIHLSSDLTLAKLREHLATLDSGQLQMLQEQCVRELEALAPILDAARSDAERKRRELQAIDASDQAARAQDALCQTSAAIERDLRPWIQLRLAHRLLLEAQRRFQERTQGPMLERASDYFRRMTDNAFARLRSHTNDADRQVLLAQRADGSAIGTEAMSEGTRDQLYLALRLAAVSLRRDAGINLPMVLDDVLMTSSDGRAGCVLQALAEFSRGSQVIVFTHHEHLVDVARRQVPAELLHVAAL